MTQFTVIYCLIYSNTSSSQKEYKTITGYH